MNRHAKDTGALIAAILFFLFVLAIAGGTWGWVGYRRAMMEAREAQMAAEEAAVFAESRMEFNSEVNETRMK